MRISMSARSMPSTRQPFSSNEHTVTRRASPSVRSKAMTFGADAPASRKRTVPSVSTAIAERSIYQYIEGDLGLRIAMSKRTITGERANARDREVLDLDGVDYLAVVSSQTFDTQGILIECTQSRHRLDLFCFRDTAVRQKV
ncbi:UTRA domain-containing protein [Collinsella tanakaei]|nr:UTRA domain-containing protein [Collinsella tanakaei]